jgi:hypothetical protein
MAGSALTVTDGTSPEQDRIVRLPNEYEPPPPPPPSSPGRLHGLSIGGMAVSALVGVAALFAFITVGWPDPVRRILVVTFFLAGIAFLACASAAVFTAARDTYPGRGGQPLD